MWQQTAPSFLFHHSITAILISKIKNALLMQKWLTFLASHRSSQSGCNAAHGPRGGGVWILHLKVYFRKLLHCVPCKLSKWRAANAHIAFAKLTHSPSDTQLMLYAYVLMQLCLFIFASRIVSKTCLRSETYISLYLLAYLLHRVEINRPRHNLHRRMTHQTDFQAYMCI